jgi:hypothetical protein
LQVAGIATNAHAKWDSRLRGNDVFEPTLNGDRAKKNPPDHRSGGFFLAARRCRARYCYQPATACKAALNVALGRITAFTLASSAL